MNALDPAILKVRVQRLKAVPTLPKLLERISAALEDPDIDFARVGELIEIDQALTSQVLRLANSAFYSQQGRVGHVAQALVMLGAVVTRSIVLSSSVVEFRRVKLRGFWEHSLGCAVAAGAIAKVVGRGAPEEVTAAGLLHDLGKVVVYKEMPDVFEHLVAGSPPVPRRRARVPGGRSCRDRRLDGRAMAAARHAAGTHPVPPHAGAGADRER
jgi:HD-like signal output (HDOD) protein